MKTIKCILKGIKKRPEYAVMAVCVILLYSFNNIYLKVVTVGIVNYFFVCYFNDLICPVLFLSYINILTMSVNKEVRKLWVILVICILSGLFWELKFPMLKHEAVSDPYDILFYIFGGLIYCIIVKVIEVTRKAKR